MWHDVRLAIRQAVRRPGFSIAVVLTLAIATAVTAVVGSIVDRVLVRPLPFAHADRVVGVWFSSPNFPGGLTRVRQSKATFEHVRQSAESFEHFALAEDAAVTLDLGGSSTRVRAAQVTSELFDVLGIAVARGRNLGPDDTRPGATPVVVLTDGTWRTRFGSDDAIVGRELRLDGVTHQVVGVLPAGVRFPVSETELWVPLTIDPAQLGGQDFVYTGYGLTKPGLTESQMHDDLARVIDRLPDAYPETIPRPLLDQLQLSGLFVPLLEEMVGQVRRPLLFALIATLVVLLTVLANLTNLLLLRQEGRHLEMAIRSAIGAGPARLRRIVVSEALTLAVAGGVLGLGMALAAVKWVREAAVSVLPRATEISLEPMTAILCLTMVSTLGLFVGTAASRRSDVRGLDALRQGGRGGAHRSGTRLRWVLVGGQVALAVVAATGAGLLVRSASALAAVEPGFSTTGLGGVRLFLPPSAYPTLPQVTIFYQTLLDDLRETPGVESAAVVAYLPLRDGRILYPYRIEGEIREGTLPSPRQTKLVFDGYFSTMGIPLTEGRGIERRDIETMADVAVINAALARAHWPGVSAIGKRLRSDASGPWLTVVGVVGNELDRSLIDPPPPIVYLPYQARHATDRRFREMSIVVKATRASDALSIVRRTVSARDRSVPVSNASTMTDVLAAATARTRYTMRLVVFCAAAALFLAVIGLYAVLANTVAARQKEVAIRMALGATSADIRTLLLTRVVLTFAVGGSVGAILAAVSGRLAEGLLFGVRPADAPTIITVAILVGLAGWLGTIAPTRRATTATPATLLRSSDHG